MLPLFRREVVLASLSSGSSGNCTYVGDRRQGVLVDCGLSTRQVLARLDACGLAGVHVLGVLVTHEHMDHVGAARVLERRLRERQGRAVPFFMTRGTWEGMNERVRPDGVELIRAGHPFWVGGVEADPFSVPHDVRDPVAWRVRVGGATVAVVTDLGRPTQLVAEKLRSCDAAVLEFNHDEELLLGGPYPWALKQRVRSNHGHLSNRQAAELLRAGLSDRLRFVLLGHLSDDNNRSELALAAARRAVAGAEVRLEVAAQRTGSAPVVLETAWA